MKISSSLSQKTPLTVVATTPAQRPMSDLLTKVACTLSGVLWLIVDSFSSQCGVLGLVSLDEEVEPGRLPHITLISHIISKGGPPWLPSTQSSS